MSMMYWIKCVFCTSHEVLNSSFIMLHFSLSVFEIFSIFFLTFDLDSLENLDAWIASI